MPASNLMLNVLLKCSPTPDRWELRLVRDSVHTGASIAPGKSQCGALDADASIGRRFYAENRESRVRQVRKE